MAVKGLPGCESINSKHAGPALLPKAPPRCNHSLALSSKTEYHQNGVRQLIYKCFLHVGARVVRHRQSLVASSPFCRPICSGLPASGALRSRRLGATAAGSNLCLGKSRANLEREIAFFLWSGVSVSGQHANSRWLSGKSSMVSSGNEGTTHRDWPDRGWRVWREVRGVPSRGIHAAMACKFHLVPTSCGH